MFVKYFYLRTEYVGHFYMKVFIFLHIFGPYLVQTKMNANRKRNTSNTTNRQTTES